MQAVIKFAFDFWEWLDLNAVAQWATALGLPCGVAAAFAAIKSYRSAIRATADAHMHALFRDYLQKRIDRDTLALSGTPATAMIQIDSEIRSAKHYVLEEMFDWLVRQWPKPRRSIFITRQAYQRRLDTLMAWKSTIAYHLKSDASAEDLIESIQCYGKGFLLFAAETLRSEELRLLTERRKTAWEPLIFGGPIAPATGDVNCPPVAPQHAPRLP